VPQTAVPRSNVSPSSEAAVPGASSSTSLKRTADRESAVVDSELALLKEDMWHRHMLTARVSKDS
jgi:hypothetical protein